MAYFSKLRYNCCMENNQLLCACGCGQPVKIRRYPSQVQAKFINGHQHKGENNGNYRGGKAAKVCGVCGETFYVIPAMIDVRKTCGKDECYKVWQGLTTSARGRHKVEVKCDACGKTVYRWPSQIKDKRQIFCSDQCRDKSCGNDRANEKAHNWKGGNSAWKRKKIIERDEHKCVICGFDFFVEVHHITARSKGGTDEFHNLICLCPNHHKMADLGLVDLEPYRNYLKRP